MSRVIKSAPATQAAVFGDISAIAERERVQLFGPPPEPAELQLLRLQASDEAQQIINEALAHADIIARDVREAARREGYAAGYAEGQAAGSGHIESAIESFRNGVSKFTRLLEAETERLWRESEAQIVVFVLEVAQKVIKDHAAINRDMVIAAVKTALRRVVEAKRITIRVNESDLNLTRASRQDLLSLIDSVERLDIIEDRRVSPGGCVVETDAGTIDARIETQLDEVKKSFAILTQEAA